MQGFDWMRFTAWSRRSCLMALCAGLVASCGGGVDSGGTGAPATSFASGPISGFGSVIVSDVHFDDRSAAITNGDGNVRSASDLRLGMTTRVLGTPISVDADGGDISTATSIVFASEIVGPLTANDPIGRTMTALEQTIDISASTVFDDALASGQASLAVGDIVEVYALFDVATGHYDATRVERKTASTGAELRGVVSALDASAKAFSIGAARISYAGLPAASVPSTLANGRLVRVALTGSGGTWVASRLVDSVAPVPDHDDAKIKGLVSAFTSSTQFSVDGTPVDAGSAAFPNGSAGLVLGARVEVRGATVGGVLVATRVTLDTSDGSGGGGEFEVRDLIASIDTAGQTFVAHGVRVSYAGAVDFRNGTVADLAVGRNVEARGSLSADGTRLQATRITFRN